MRSVGDSIDARSVTIKLKAIDRGLVAKAITPVPPVAIRIPFKSETSFPISMEAANELRLARKGRPPGKKVRVLSTGVDFIGCRVYQVMIGGSTP